MTENEKLKLAVKFIRKIMDMGCVCCADGNVDELNVGPCPYGDISDEAWHVLADMEEL